MGFSKVYALKGGYQDWKKAGYPMELKTTQEQTECVNCHTVITPDIVSEWKQSKHSLEVNDVHCSVCHGTDHSTATDVDQAEPVTPHTCRTCHEEQWDQFRVGKHARAWQAMQDLPSYHWTEPGGEPDQDQCTGCHAIGFKDQEEIAALEFEDSSAGKASCDFCHSRHDFSVHKARRPEACLECHQGPDQPMQDIFFTSEHGRLLEIPQDSQDQPELAPTCQTCHMQDGQHGVHTAWGSLGVRLPFPWASDPEWAEARRTVLKGVRALAPEGGSKKRLKAMTGNDLFRISDSGWKQARAGMIEACTDCHPRSYAKNALDRADKLLREADIFMARAIELVAGLYQDGLLKRPKSLDAPYPDLLSWPTDPEPIEVELYRMFQEYRPRTFKAALHTNEAFAQEQGLNKVRQALQEMEKMAGAMQ